MGGWGELYPKCLEVLNHARPLNRNHFKKNCAYWVLLPYSSPHNLHGLRPKPSTNANYMSMFLWVSNLKI